MPTSTLLDARTDAELDAELAALDEMLEGRTEERQVRRVPLVVRVVLTFVLFIVAGNAAILTLSAWAQRSVEAPVVDGVSKLRYVDEQLWRSAAPTEQGYRNLAAMGVTTVVDLRAEEDLVDQEPLLDELGIDLVRLPIRDGQVPPQGVIDEFLDVIHDDPGTVLVHCGAGVGRTGVMVAAYMVETGHSGIDAVRHNLSVGPPSLEQISYAVSGGERPNMLVTGVSRVLDAPRRIWHNIGL